MAKNTVIADDADAVVRSLKGDSAAFSALVTRYRSVAVAVAYSICRDRASAEDIAQDAFVRAHQKLGQLDRPESFCAWLMNIVRHAALRAAHSAARREEVHALASSHVARNSEDPTASTEFAELIASVDAETQQILTWRYRDGMKCTEIAETLGAPLGTVTSRISRALATLRTAMRRELQE